MGMHGGFYNNRKAQMKKMDKMMMDSYIQYCTPHLYAAFCLVLYDKYGWEPEQIQECVLETDALWERSAQEGWDIKQNCLECTGVNVLHFKETGKITGETKDGE